MLCVQEYWCSGLRDADRNLSVSGRGQAGDVSQHLSAQCELHRGGAAAPGPRCPVLYPDTASQTAKVSPHLRCLQIIWFFVTLFRKGTRRTNRQTLCSHLQELRFILETQSEISGCHSRVGRRRSALMKILMVHQEVTSDMPLCVIKTNF